MNNNTYFGRDLFNAFNKCDNMFVEDIAKDFQLLYPFTTENIAGYINNFNLTGRGLLTVGSSGDQIINACLFDCYDIVCLDICPFTKYYVNLKIASMLELNRRDFLAFLCFKDFPGTFKDNYRAFNKEDYNKIKRPLRVLDYDSYLFWDELFSCYSGLDIRKELFYFDENKSKVIINCNPYLQSDGLYDETRNKIRKIRPCYITDDIFKAELERSFDTIWLSNIVAYHSRHFLKILTQKMADNLNEQGKLLISYLYKTDIHSKYVEDYCPIYNLTKTFEILNEYKPNLITFIGVDGIRFHDDSIRDSVLVYTKK